MNSVETKLSEINQCIIKYIDETDGENTLPNLYIGDMGIAMFLSHYDRLKKDEQTTLYFEKILNRSFDRIGNGYYVHTFCSGISGAFYSMIYLKDEFKLTLPFDNKIYTLKDGEMLPKMIIQTRKSVN